MRGKSIRSAVVMGDESLLMHGAEAWLERGHTIVAVVTEVREIVVWAESKGVRVISPDDDLEAGLGEQTFDYLLSLANMRGIPEPVLGLAEKGVIHYHDGPFPRFAGAYPTTWAIVEGATRYGITWLRASAEGESEVLLERTFELSPDETRRIGSTRRVDAPGRWAISTFVDRRASSRRWYEPSTSGPTATPSPCLRSRTEGASSGWPRPTRSTPHARMSADASSAGARATSTSRLETGCYGSRASARSKDETSRRSSGPWWELGSNGRATSSRASSIA
jgi:hypothetical protein